MYLIRHGSVEFPEGKRRCIGRTDLPLSEAGRAQARALAEYFADRSLEAVYASPLSRAVETAVILAGERFPVTTAEGLLELDMGEWENVPLKDIKKELESEPELGERRADGLVRFQKIIKEILDSTRGDVAVVAHAGINCCFLSSLMGTPLETSRALPQPYGCFSRILVRETVGAEEHRAAGSEKLGQGSAASEKAGQEAAASEKTGQEAAGRGLPGYQLQVSELGRMPAEAPSVQECERIWDRYQTPEAVREHCRAVEKQAAWLTRALLKAGQSVDPAVVQAAALLHDVARTEKDHPAAGARILVREGYPRIASIILCHHDWERGKEKNEDLEAAIVYLADKQVQGTRPVTLAERFAKSRSRCEQQEDAAAALEALEKRHQQAQAIETALMNMLHQAE